jgi:hypothetical protein
LKFDFNGYDLFPDADDEVYFSPGLGAPVMDFRTLPPGFFSEK